MSEVVATGFLAVAALVVVGVSTRVVVRLFRGSDL